MVFETAFLSVQKPFYFEDEDTFIYSNKLSLQVVHRQEVRLRVQGQEQDQRARERRQVRHEGHLGEGEQLVIETCLFQ